MIALLFTRRFLPFFLCQFLGAFNDNLFRLALVAMLSFGALKADDSSVFIQLSAGVFMLPFFLFSAAAGDITDGVSKRRLLVQIKSAELVIMSIGAAAMYWQSLPLILLCLLLTGTQSAFFGPVKYALLPTLLKRDELLNGNAWFSVSTFTAILAGTVLGTVGGKSPDFAAVLCGGFVTLSALGLAAAVLVPLDAPAETTRPPFTPLRSFRTVLAAARADKIVFRCILAGSWFWLIGVMLLNELALLPYEVYTEMLAAVLTGVGIGALLCGVVFRGEITTRFAPLTLFIGGVLLAGIATLYEDASAGGTRWPLAVTVAAFTAVMTLYVVPLRTVVQARSPDNARAKVIAAYNIFNALFIVLATLSAAVLHASAGADNATPTILSLSCVLSLTGAVLVCSVLPLESVRRVLARLFRLLFRVRVQGLEHLQEKSTLISNHQSFLDGPLLAAFLQSEQRKLGFPIDVEQSRRFFTRQILKLVHSYPLNPMEPQGVRTLIREIENSDEEIRPLIFSEGRITTSGGLMKSYPGAGIIAEKISGGKITPVIIDGAQYSKVSRMQGKFPLRWLPPITITVFPPRQLTPPAKLFGAAKRRWLARRMDYLLEDSLFAARRSSTGGNLTARFAASAAQFGGSAPLFAEFPLRRLSYRQVFTAAHALGALLHHRHKPGERIGLLLPSSVGACVFFYAAQFQRLTPVLLNPSVGAAQSLSSCRTATLDTVYTSAQLLQRAPMAAQVADALAAAGIKVVPLESLRAELTLPIKLRAAHAGFTMQRSVRNLPGYAAAADDHAAVLFTSGSEGVPKGVALSHDNLLVNSEQALARLDVTSQDIMLNALPVFHSFGLLGGVVLPVAAGMETWQYPSPLHYKMVPEAIYGSNATVFFSANTFLNHYGKVAHEFDFRSLRLVIAGAEKLRDETKQLWRDKFGIRILEGYGVTETAPALAANSPLHNRDGSVGRLLPGIRTRLEPVPDIARGGRLSVAGDNIMAGYFTADAPGVLKPPPDGWHDTGDIVDIDDDGYLTILGRAKRFIKVAGEMVPLDSVEECFRKRWEGLFAVVGVADSRRGEALALMTTAEITRDDLAAALREDALPELWLPRHLKVVKEMPLLSTGKTNYPAITKLFTE